ncbi:high frequency lysogenization protein HflD [Thalassotalea litorea]|uniref:High frequency lysogenization protein HflD homolog n=1 Tax=Thalassotalea litorea TaxID=2020715 RepID=A0A5R9IP84_9GAMM|nr:high frequency lysogenization protein HflD [Thalassotalea litorea]TLU66283.1 high frequency lysogenization protein HflD [Thalassotalea litorea]
MRQQTLTFAAICQAAAMIQGIARKNQLDEPLFELMLNSIVITDPKDSLEVYGSDIAHLKKGLQLIVSQLGDTTAEKDPEITRYIVSMLNLERRLQNKKKDLASLGSRIDQCQRQLDHFELTSDTMIANFANVYIDVISPLATRIQIAGEQSILKQVGNQNRIRALLLSGIRAAVLWRQMGGKRRVILFRRRQVVAEAQKLLKSIH